jgi:hypothetical protein
MAMEPEPVKYLKSGAPRAPHQAVVKAVLARGAGIRDNAPLGLPDYLAFVTLVESDPAAHSAKKALPQTRAFIQHLQLENHTSRRVNNMLPTHGGAEAALGMGVNGGGGANAPQTIHGGGAGAFDGDDYDRNDAGFYDGTYHNHFPPAVGRGGRLGPWLHFDPVLMAAAQYRPVRSSLFSLDPCMAVRTRERCEHALFHRTICPSPLLQPYRPYLTHWPYRGWLVCRQNGDPNGALHPLSDAQREAVARIGATARTPAHDLQDQVNGPMAAKDAALMNRNILWGCFNVRCSIFGRPCNPEPQ